MKRRYDTSDESMIEKLIGFGDYSSRKSYYPELRKKIDDLNNLKNYFQNVIDSMPSVLVGIDCDFRITQMNREAEKLSGLSVGMAQNMALTEIFPNVAGEMDLIRNSIEKGRVRRKSKMAVHENDSTRFYELTVYPLSSDRPEGAVIRLDDITDRVRMEEMVIQSEKMLSVGGLAAGMAHEINNPLAGILQNLQVIQNRFSTDFQKNTAVAQACGFNLNSLEKYLEKRGIEAMMENIGESARRAADIVSNMLSFSRKGHSEFLPHDICELLDKTVDLAATDYDLKKKYDFRKIEIERDYDKSLPGVPCEAAEIQQVVLNILKNGAEEMSEMKRNGHPPRFKIRVSGNGDSVRIEISDNGPGISEKLQRRIFEPFFTTKGNEGTGLGLSVSYFIITEKHNGSLSVESAPGRGATFIITLPVNPDISRV